MLNNKGFTLVELLATIVILGIVMSVTASIGINIYKNSKIKAEGIFISELNKVIEDYITLNTDTLVKKNKNITMKKCDLSDEAIDSDNCKDKKVYNIYKIGTTWLNFNDIINEDTSTITAKDLTNPYDSSTCNANSSIEIYLDEDGVYYFRYKLECIKNDENKHGNWTYSNATFLE